MAKRMKKDIIKEIKERGIKYDENATIDQLEDLLIEEKPVKGEIPKPMPKRMRKRIIDGKPVEVPCAVDVPSGRTTTNDHERRIIALEIAAGIKKVEEYEVKD